ncbi:MAG: ATP-dependent helicase, partial [Candidatus Latescibacteria bacterium]|nr:ATP-dependent helicase [Candidatus Latescibacterota bacterium]
RANELIAAELRAAYQFVFVDEYQDINAAQHALLKELVRDGVQLTAIGDPNQAIYGFRGAESKFFVSFPADFPGATVLSLSANYRSAVDLLAASEQVIRKSGLPDVPPLVATLSHQGCLTIHEAATDRAEAEYVVHQVEKLVGGTSLFSQDSGRVAREVEAERSFGEVAVLYRLNAQRGLLEEAFQRSGIPYQVSGDRPLIAQPGVSEVTAFLRLSHSAAVTPEAARRLLASVVEGIGEKTASECEARWRKVAASVAVDSLRALLKSRTLLSDRARAGLSGLLQGIDATAGQLRTSGISAALQSLLALPDWLAVFSADPAAEERLHKLIRLARLHTDVTAYLDHILLHGDAEPVGLDSERVSLLTLHAAKGLEFSVVFIVGCEQQLLPLQLPDRDSDSDEERRLFYVGMTRAKERLYLVRAKRRSLFGRTYETEPSPFLSDIAEALKQYEYPETLSRPRAAKENTQQLNLFEEG